MVGIAREIVEIGADRAGDSSLFTWEQPLTVMLKTLH